MRFCEISKLFFSGVTTLLLAFSVNSFPLNAKTVTVKFQTGIYRDWDHSWMTTAPSDVIATITTSKGTFTKSPANYSGTVTFTNIPCGETVKINIRFVGTGGYSSKSRNYSKAISCAKSVVNLGRLEFGKW